MVLATGLVVVVVAEVVVVVENSRLATLVVVAMVEVEVMLVDVRWRFQKGRLTTRLGI